MSDREMIAVDEGADSFKPHLSQSLVRTSMKTVIAPSSPLQAWGYCQRVSESVTYVMNQEALTRQ